MLEIEWVYCDFIGEAPADGLGVPDVLGRGAAVGFGGGDIMPLALLVLVPMLTAIVVHPVPAVAAAGADDALHHRHGLLVGQHNLLLYGLGQLAVVLGETADEARLAATVEEGCVLYRLNPKVLQH